MELIKTNNLIKNYQHKKLITPVLKGISISVHGGDFLSIIGPSGSGKTTLLYVLSGLEPYSGGHISMFSKELRDYEDKEISQLRQDRIGFVFQFYNLIPNLTVYENIQLAVVLSSKEPKMVIEDVLKSVGLLAFKNYYPNQLSGGMQQRVAIARCLINDPDIIFADEPIGNLDYKSGLEVMELFQELNQKWNKTIILVTHNEDMVKFGTRMIKLVDGVILIDEKV